MVGEHKGALHEPTNATKSLFMTRPALTVSAHRNLEASICNAVQIHGV